MFVLASIGILALLILVHEAGHFAAARLQGIHVNRFSIGFGPILWRHRGAKTEYALRALPLGGFVGFPDEDDDCPYPANDPDLLKNRPIMDRAVVLSAGVLANLTFAYLALVIMTATVGIPTPLRVDPGILIPQVVADGPAQAAGIEAGDIVLSANQLDFRQVDTPAEAEDAISQFQAMVRLQPEGSQAIPPINLVIQRLGQADPLPVTVTPVIKSPGDNPIIGVNLSANEEMGFRPAASIGEILGEAAAMYQQIVQINVNGLTQLVANFQNTAGQLSGPVGIINIGAKLAQSNAVSLFNFTALISINLGILNLLPLPALDGGHLLLLVLEALRGKRLPKSWEEKVMQGGLVFFLGLGVVLILKDTMALVTGSG